MCSFGHVQRTLQGVQGQPQARRDMTKTTGNWGEGTDRSRGPRRPALVRERPAFRHRIAAVRGGYPEVGPKISRGAASRNRPDVAALTRVRPQRPRLALFLPLEGHCEQYWAAPSGTTQASRAPSMGFGAADRTRPAAGKHTSGGGAADWQRPPRSTQPSTSERSLAGCPLERGRRSKAKESGDLDASTMNASTLNPPHRSDPP